TASLARARTPPAGPTPPGTSPGSRPRGRCALAAEGRGGGPPSAAAARRAAPAARPGTARRLRRHAVGVGPPRSDRRSCRGPYRDNRARGPEPEKKDGPGVEAAPLYPVPGRVWDTKRFRKGADFLCPIHGPARGLPISALPRLFLGRIPLSE